jgi:hypothetical protein
MPKFAVEHVALLLYNPAIPGSNLGPETGCSGKV